MVNSVFGFTTLKSAEKRQADTFFKVMVGKGYKVPDIADINGEMTRDDARVRMLWPDGTVTYATMKNKPVGPFPYLRRVLG